MRPETVRQICRPFLLAFFSVVASSQISPLLRSKISQKLRTIKIIDKKLLNKCSTYFEEFYFLVNLRCFERAGENRINLQNLK